MKYAYVVNYEDGIISKIDPKDRKYRFATKHSSFKEAKADLIEYCKYSLFKSKQALKSARAINIKNFSTLF
jgi:hypothetical protein